MLLIKTVIKIYIWFVFFRKWLIYKLEQQFLSQSSVLMKTLKHVEQIISIVKI